MRFGYKFSNLYGTVYSQGNLVFTPDGNSILSPVGNRVSCFNLVTNTSFTFPFECSKDVEKIVLSPDGVLMIMIDEDGRALLVNFARRALLHRFNFKTKVLDAKFSPCGRFMAVTHKRQIHIWRTPAATKEFAPFALFRKYTGHFDDVTCLDWSHDSKFFVTGSRDNTCRVYTLASLEHYKPVALTAHRDRIVGVFFAKDSMDIYSTSYDGTCLIWKSRWVPAVAPKKGGSAEKGGDDDDEEEEEDPAMLPRWSLSKEDKHYFLQDHAKLICAVLHKASNVLIAGFSNGVFGLYELPDFNNIHTLSISNKRISSACVNASGEWLGFGCAKAGQLLVWEWQSETYILKQQGHHYDMNKIAYSPDGHLIATGGHDGKIKIWNTSSGFCSVTFTEHSGGITGLLFAQSGISILSASLDGTIRAFDLLRYRNFRTFTSPEPTQFSCLALDPSGELVCAGCQDTFQIYIWSMKTGRLLDVLAGHEAPIADIIFNPIRSFLASASWDNTVRLWDVFEKKATQDTLELGSDVVALAYRGDGRELCCSTLNGQLTIWDVTGPAAQLGAIEGRKDIAGGRLSTDRITAKHSDASKCFESICYSADGSCLLAGGSTKYVCIYDLAQKVLLKRFCISNNLSLDGTRTFLNSKGMTEAGPAANLDVDSDSDVEDRLDSDLPGVTRGDFSTRKTRPAIRTKCVQFAPTGRAWAAASTAGLLIYSLDDTMVFDPYDLDMDVTPQNVRKTLANREYTKALVMAFRLGEKELEEEVMEAVPPGDVQLVAELVPVVYLNKQLAALASKLESSPHLEFYLQWTRHLLNAHGRFLQDNAPKHMTALRSLVKSLGRQHDGIGTVCEENRYSLQYLLASATLQQTKDAMPGTEDADTDE